MEQRSLAPKGWERIYNAAVQEKEMIKFCFLATFLWGMAAHAYGIVHLNLSHDSLNAFVAPQWEEIWKIMLGRYFVPVYRAVFRGPINLPWLIGLWGLFWSAIGVYMVTRLLEIRSKFQAALVSGIMVTNITYISQIATYLYEFDFNSFSIVLAIGAVCLWRFKPGLPGCVLGSVCVMLSIGIYQSFIAVAVTLIIWISIMDLLQEKPVKIVFQYGLRGIGMLVLGGLFYLVAGKVIHFATGIGLETRTDALYVEEGSSLISEYINLIIPAIIDLGSNIVHPVYRRVPQIIAIVCILMLLVILVLTICRRKKFTWDRIALLGVLCIALPFGINCVYFLAKGEGMHDLTTYATWYFYIILLHLAFWVLRNSGELCRVAVISFGATCILLVCVLVQNVTLANTTYVKKKMDVDSTLSTMTRVVAMLEQREDYEIGETKVSFVGTIDNSASRPAFDNIRLITGMNADRTITFDEISWNYNVYDAYLRYVMNYPLNLIGKEERAEKVLSSPELEAMPAYPNPGCIQWVNGILVVKMGYLY